MSSIAPGVFMARHIGFSTLLESHCPCFGCPPGGQGSPPVSDRVNALQPKLAAFPRELTRPGKANGMGGTEAHIVQTAVLTETKNPALCTALANAQIQTTAVGVHAFVVEPRNLGSRKPIECPHCRPMPLPIFGMPTLADGSGPVKTSTLKQTRMVVGLSRRQQTLADTSRHRAPGHGILRTGAPRG